MSYTNRPIAPSTAEIQEWLADTQDALVQRRDEILAGFQRFLSAYPNGIPDEGVQARAADFAGGKGIMNAFLKEATASRVSEKAPFLAGGKTIDGFFGALTDPVERAQAHTRSLMTQFANKLEAERRAVAKAEAERLAQEAAIAQDNAQDEESLQHAADVAQAAEAARALAEGGAAALSQTRGDLGTVVSLRTQWKPDYENASLLELVKAVAEGRAPLDYLTFNETRINYAVRSEKVRSIPGVPVIEVRSVV